MHLDFKDLNILLQLTRQRQPVANDSWPLFCGTQQEVDVRLGRLERLGIVSLSGEGRKVEMPEIPARIIAVDMGATNTRYMVADLRGHVHATFRDHAASGQTPENALKQVSARIRCLRDSHCAQGSLKAIAIGVPSAVHPETALLISANNLDGWKDVSVRDVLANDFGVPVLLDNDCNMAAIGEYWRGASIGVGNFVFLAVGTGIGAGIFIDHKIYRGRTGSAGEVYLMNVDWRRWNEDFGETGHVESYASGVGISEQARLAGVLSRSQKTTDLDDRDSRRVFAAMRRGNPAASAVVKEVFTVLGVAVANLISTLDPELVVLNGGLTKGDPNLLLGTIHNVVHHVHRDVPTIRLSALGDKAQLYGSLWTGLQHVFTTMAAKAEGERNGHA
jgi:glucokinase